VIWILWHRRLGDLNQMQELAKALGLPFVVKKLHFRKPFYAPLANLTLDKSKSDSLQAPWPNIVICAEALTSVVTHSLKKKSAGHIKTVALARPSGSVRDFDLVLTTAQYRLPQMSNVVELNLPLTAARLESKKSSSRIAVLIGATSPPDQLDPSAALKLVGELNTLDGPLDIITSPRTTVAVSDILSAGFKAPHKVYRWQVGVENPYARLIVEAAAIIVTSDSVSMLADAVVAGKPVQVYPLPRRFSVAQRFVEWLYKISPENWIFRSGIIEPATDRRLLIERLISQGHVSWFGTQAKSAKPFNRMDDIETAVNAIRKLL
jgi:uncharacterized protein